MNKKQKILLLVTVMTILVTYFYKRKRRILYYGMTMSQVEEAIGSPDETRMENEDSTIAPIIIWKFNQFPILSSGPDYKKQGYLEFIQSRYADKLSKEDNYILWKACGSFSTKDDLNIEDGCLAFRPFMSQ